MLSAIAALVRVRGDEVRGEFAASNASAARGDVITGVGVREGGVMGRGLRLRGLMGGEGAGVPERGAIPYAEEEERRGGGSVGGGGEGRTSARRAGEEPFLPGGVEGVERERGGIVTAGSGVEEGGG